MFVLMLWIVAGTLLAGLFANWVADNQAEIVFFAGWQAWVNGFSEQLRRSPDTVLAQKLRAMIGRRL